MPIITAIREWQNQDQSLELKSLSSARTVEDIVDARFKLLQLMDIWKSPYIVDRSNIHLRINLMESIHEMSLLIEKALEKPSSHFQPISVIMLELNKKIDKKYIQEFIIRHASTAPFLVLTLPDIVSTQWKVQIPNNILTNQLLATVHWKANHYTTFINFSNGSRVYYNDLKKNFQRLKRNQAGLTVCIM